MRDDGTCSFGDRCRYSHDRQAIAEEKRRMQASGSPAAPNAALLDPAKKGKGGDKGGGKSKGTKSKGKGKGKGGGKSQGGGSPNVSRILYPDRLCPDLRKGTQCKFGKECKFSHDKKRFDDNGNLKKGSGKRVHRVGQDGQTGGDTNLDWEPPAGMGAHRLSVLDVGATPLTRSTLALCGLARSDE